MSPGSHCRACGPRTSTFRSPTTWSRFGVVRGGEGDDRGWLSPLGELSRGTFSRSFALLRQSRPSRPATFRRRPAQADDAEDRGGQAAARQGRGQQLGTDRGQRNSADGPRPSSDPESRPNSCRGERRDAGDQCNKRRPSRHHTPPLIFPVQDPRMNSATMDIATEATTAAQEAGARRRGPVGRGHRSAPAANARAPIGSG